MNDEIKEILSLLNSSSWSNEAKQIEDYITNLQQENHELNRMCELYGKSLYYAELEDYKSRCEKAIEYIEKQKKKMYKSRNKIALFVLMKLGNILQNGSEDNE